MPDCHHAKGPRWAAAFRRTRPVIPAAIGVDIGCGMLAAWTSLKREDSTDPAEIRDAIEDQVPLSAGQYNRSVKKTAALASHRGFEQKAGDRLEHYGQAQLPTGSLQLGKNGVRKTLHRTRASTQI